jgi:hypothetical protein
MGAVFGVFVCAISFVAIVVVVLLINAFHDPNKWYGKMLCDRCSYQWISRKITSPARCPRCSTSQIRELLGLMLSMPRPIDFSVNEPAKLAAESSPG